MRGRASGGGEALDRHGHALASIGGAAALCSTFCDLPGEQILSCSDDGALRIRSDPAAEGRPAAEINRHLSSVET